MRAFSFTPARKVKRVSRDQEARHAIERAERRAVDGSRRRLVYVVALPHANIGPFRRRTLHHRPVSPSSHPQQRELDQDHKTN
jgi:hypothetical protein